MTTFFVPPGMCMVWLVSFTCLLRRDIRIVVDRSCYTSNWKLKANQQLGAGIVRDFIAYVCFWAYLWTNSMIISNWYELRAWRTVSTLLSDAHRWTKMDIIKSNLQLQTVFRKGKWTSFSSLRTSLNLYTYFEWQTCAYGSYFICANTNWTFKTEKLIFTNIWIFLFIYCVEFRDTRL